MSSFDCVPTVFAAYNHYADENEMHTYEYKCHKGGGTDHLQVQIEFLPDY